MRCKAVYFVNIHDVVHVDVEVKADAFVHVCVPESGTQHVVVHVRIHVDTDAVVDDMAMRSDVQ